ncbi:hypothetical protein [Haloarcula nitratireducens]|uniref:Tat pathway signal sequence domain protein n=1 Tax=Haloarcula nitratireducens TaxID=2487749 RepID=A0AAW4PHD6_9EURY|nr:hypothetical protein [Halomicroarcula nitratireducens]MBX0297239.1 hypothetical protein [Halomicroarcula nitratireducens]
MQRRKFMIGMGSLAAGGAAAMGTGAFSGVVSKRTASVEIAHDKNAYLGLHEIPSSPNESYVDYEGGHLRIRMDPSNPNKTGNGDPSAPNNGEGVNSDSYTWFNKLFKICNQGKQDVKVFLYKKGDNADHVVFYNGYRSGPCHGTKIETGTCQPIGMLTCTKGLEEDDSLLENLYIVALGTEENQVSTMDASAASSEMGVPSGTMANDEYVSDITFE